MALSERRWRERQEELEGVVRRIVVEKGLAGLTIERIAADSGYSRPTVYQHFACRTDALETVARASLDLATALTKRAEGFEGNPRERALALVVAYELLARFHPDSFHITEFLGFPWVVQELPEATAKAFGQMVERYFDGYRTAMEAAEAAGELSPLPETTPRVLAYQTIATLYGLLSSQIKNRLIFRLSKAAAPGREVRAAIHALWDGNGWRPMWADKDYEETRESILKGTFPDYWVRIKTAALAREVGQTP